MPKLTQLEIDSALLSLNGWNQTGAELRQQFQFEDFRQAMDFVNRIAALAEAADYHPDIDIRYNKVSLVLATHSHFSIPLCAILCALGVFVVNPKVAATPSL